MADKEVKREIIRRLSYKGEEEAKKEEPKVEEHAREEAPASIIKREVVRRLSYKGEEEAPKKPVVYDDSNMPGFSTAETFRYETALLSFMIELMLFLYGFCAEIHHTEHFGLVYQMYLGVTFMMFFGFGYLMTFLKRYGMGAVGFTMLITVLGLLWGVLVEAFFRMATDGEFTYVAIEMLHLMDALFLVAAILISFGGIIGKVSPLQLVFMTIFETIFYSINKRCLLMGVVEFVDGK